MPYIAALAALTEHFAILEHQNPNINKFVYFRNVDRHILVLKDCDRESHVENYPLQ